MVHPEILKRLLFLSEQVSNLEDKHALSEFIGELHEKFRGYVRDAAAIARS